MSLSRVFRFALATAMVGGAAAGAHAANAGSGSKVIQSVPPPVTASAKPPLHLTDEQKARIQQVLGTKHNEIEFRLKTTKSAKAFEPKVGATVPKKLKAQAFPPPLISEIPQTRPYAYLKLKGQIVVVDLMTRRIVDVFPERRATSSASSK